MMISNLLKMFKVQQHLNSNFIISLHFHFNVQHLNLNSQVNSLNLFILLCLVILKKNSQQKDISAPANLHLAERHNMLVPSTRTQLGLRSFHVAAPAVCNVLPSSAHHPLVMDSLQTNLFTHAYGHLSELLLKSVLFYITFTFYTTFHRLPAF